MKAPVGDNINVLALFDVNNFTAVNVEYGYKAGELSLKNVAECLEQVTRVKDIIGRVGTEQFIVCLVNIEDDVAKELFGRINKALNNVSFKTSSGRKVDVHSNMHIYSSVTGLSDANDVLAEIRSVLRKS